MLVTTANEVAGLAITEHMGIVRGIVVRSPNIAQGFLGSLKQIVGGNISIYTNLCEQARRDSYELMIQHAVQLGANALISVRYDATEVGPGVTEVLAYGTAVQVEPAA